MVLYLLIYHPSTVREKLLGPPSSATRSTPCIRMHEGRRNGPVLLIIELLQFEVEKERERKGDCIAFRGHVYI